MSFRILFNLSVNIRHNIVKRTADCDKVSDFAASCKGVDNSRCRKRRGYKLETVRIHSAIAFEVNTECATATLYCEEPVTYRELEHLGYFHAIFAFGDIVD